MVYLYIHFRHDLFIHPLQTWSIYASTSYMVYLYIHFRHGLFIHPLQTWSIYTPTSDMVYLYTYFRHGLFIHLLQTWSIYTPTSDMVYLYTYFRHHKPSLYYPLLVKVPMTNVYRTLPIRIPTWVVQKLIHNSYVYTEHYLFKYPLWVVKVPRTCFHRTLLYWIPTLSSKSTQDLSSQWKYPWLMFSQNYILLNTDF